MMDGSVQRIPLINVTNLEKSDQSDSSRAFGKKKYEDKTDLEEKNVSVRSRFLSVLILFGPILSGI